MPPKPYAPNDFPIEDKLSAGERQELNAEFAGTTEPPAIVDFEAFETWTHKQIAEALAGANTDNINDTATAWRGIYSTGEQALPDFADKMQASIDADWQGASGQAAKAAVKDYSDQAKQLLVSILMVASDLDRTESVIREAQKRVGTPPEDPNPGSTAAHAEARAEAEAEARRVMLTFYQPGVAEVDARTPRLPEPQPVAAAPSESGSSASGSAAVGGAGDDGAGDAGGTVGGAPGGAAGGGASEAATRAASTTSQPSGGSGGGTSAASAGSGAGPTNSSPGGATTAGLAGGAAGALAAAAPSLGGPLSRGSTAGPVVAAAPGNLASTRGSAPMGGMYPPMGRGRGDDEDNREPNSYLVAASNASELVGELPLTTNPVIGE